MRPRLAAGLPLSWTSERTIGWALGPANMPGGHFLERQPLRPTTVLLSTIVRGRLWQKATYPDGNRGLGAQDQAPERKVLDQVGIKTLLWRADEQFPRLSHLWLDADYGATFGGAGGGTG